MQLDTVKRNFDYSHYFWFEQGEEHYQDILLKYLIVVDKADSLGVFTAKEDIDLDNRVYVI
jgi:hypothetical protein